MLFLETPVIETMWKSGKSASTTTSTSAVWHQNFQDELLSIRQDPLSDQLQLQSQELDAMRNDPASSRARMARQKLRRIIVNDDAVWKAVRGDIRRLNLCTNHCIGELLNIDLLERAAAASMAREGGQRRSPRSAPAAYDKMRDNPSNYPDSNSAKIWDGNDEFVSNLRSLLKYCTSVPEKERQLSSGARERMQSGSSSRSIHSTESSSHPNHSRRSESSLGSTFKAGLNKAPLHQGLSRSKVSFSIAKDEASTKNLRNTSLHDYIIPLQSKKLPLDKKGRVDSAFTQGENRQLSLDLTSADTTEQLLSRWSTKDSMHTPKSTTITKDTPARKNPNGFSSNTPYLSSLHRDESLRTLLSQALSSPEMDVGGDATKKTNEIIGGTLSERRFDRGRSRCGVVVGEPLFEDFPGKETSPTSPDIDGNLAKKDYATMRPTTGCTVSTASSSIGSSSAARRKGVPNKRKPSTRQLARGSEVIFENFLEKDNGKKS